jgi:hypothetical protein
MQSDVMLTCRFSPDANAARPCFEVLAMHKHMLVVVGFRNKKKPCSVGRQGSTGWRLAQARGGSPTYSHHNNAAVTSPAPAFSTGSKRGPSLTACCKPRLLASNSESTALLLLRLRLTADFTISSLDYTCLNCYQRYGSTRRGGDRFDGAMTCSMETSVGAATEIQLRETKHIRRPVWRIAARRLRPAGVNQIR